MNAVYTLHSMIESLVKRTINKKQYETIPHFYGLILGDGSYTCKYSKSRLSIETSHIGTLLAFIVSALNLNTPIILYTFPRKDNLSFSKWKIRCDVHINHVKQNLCSKTKLEIAKLFSSPPPQWFSFNAGLMDSDGAIIISIKKRNRPRPRLYLEPEIIIMDQDKTFLDYVCSVWKKCGIHGYVHRHPDNVYRFRITSKPQILRFLEYVTPYMYNIERLGKASLLIPYLKEYRDLTLLKSRVKMYNNVMNKLQIYTRRLSQQLYEANRKLLIYKKK